MKPAPARYEVSPELAAILSENVVSEFAEAWRQAFRDEALMGFVEWVEKHRLLPPDAAMQGRFRWEEVPYLIEIAERIFNGEAEAKVMALGKGSQLGFTDLIINCLLYILSGSGTNRQPALFLSATEEIARDMVKDRLRPELERPPFKDMFGPGGSKSTRNTLSKIRTPGGSVAIDGGQSVNSFAARSAGKSFADEAARMPLEVGKEGDVLSLLRKRIATYGDAGRVVLNSTPVGAAEETGSFAAILEAGDKRKYFVPCPHCGEFQTLELENFRIDRDADGMAVDGHFSCVECGERMQEKHRRGMVQAGEWRPTKKPKYKDVTSYVGISQFYSLLGVTLGSIAVEYDSMLNGDSSKITFWNTVLGLGMDTEIESVGTEEARKHVYSNPDKKVSRETIDILTAGIDVQRKFVVASVYGWQRSSKRGWLIDHQEIPGEWASPVTRERVKAFLREGYEVDGGEEGERIYVSCAAVDSGDGETTDAVYRFCEEYNQPEVESTNKWRIRGAGGMMVIPFKGTNAVEQRAIIHQVGNIPRSVKRRTRASIRVWFGAGTILKAMLYKALAVAPDVAMDGTMKFREETPAEFFKEITAERPEEQRTATGHKRLRFRLSKGIANEALDCWCMARLAVEVIWSSVGGGARGLRRNRPQRPDTPAASAQATPKPTAVEPAEPAAEEAKQGEKRQRVAPKRRRSAHSGSDIVRLLRERREKGEGN